MFWLSEEAWFAGDDGEDEDEKKVNPSPNPRIQQRVVVFSIPPATESIPYTAVYGDEEEAEHQVGQVQTRFPQAIGVRVMDASVAFAQYMRERK